MTPDAEATFSEWTVLELMGRRRLAGLVTEQVIAGHGFLRIDVFPGESIEPTATQYYSPGSVYAMTPVSETLARNFAKNNQPAPVTRWDLPTLPSGIPSEDDERYDDHDLDDDD